MLSCPMAQLCGTEGCPHRLCVVSPALPLAMLTKRFQTFCYVMRLLWPARLSFHSPRDGSVSVTTIWRKSFKLVVLWCSSCGRKSYPFAVRVVFPLSAITIWRKSFKYFVKWCNCYGRNSLSFRCPRNVSTFYHHSLAERFLRQSKHIIYIPSRGPNSSTNKIPF
jgi:hypothetical protein